MAYRNTFFRWLFLYSLTFGLTYVLKLFTYLCPETGQTGFRLKAGVVQEALISYISVEFLAVIGFIGAVWRLLVWGPGGLLL